MQQGAPVHDHRQPQTQRQGDQQAYAGDQHGGGQVDSEQGEAQLPEPLQNLDRSGQNVGGVDLHSAQLPQKQQDEEEDQRGQIAPVCLFHVRTCFLSTSIRSSRRATMSGWVRHSRVRG